MKYLQNLERYAESELFLAGEQNADAGAAAAAEAALVAAFPDLEEKKEEFNFKLPTHKLDCPNADLVTFWKDVTKADMLWKTPYLDPSDGPKYITFEPGKKSFELEYI